MKLKIGKVIKRIRKLKGLTQASLARHAGISEPYLSLIENDSRSPGVELLASISSALELSPSIVLFLAAEPIKLDTLDGKILQNLSHVITDLIEDAFSPQQSLEL